MTDGTELPDPTSNLAGSQVWTLDQLVAHNLSHLRIMRGMTQADLAEKLTEITGKPWSKATISAAERSVAGERVRSFGPDDLVAFAIAFAVPASFFLLPSVEDDAPEFYMIHSGRTLHPAALIMYVIGDEQSDGWDEYQALVGSCVALYVGYRESIFGERLSDRQGDGASAVAMNEWRRVLAEIDAELRRTLEQGGGIPGDTAMNSTPATASLEREIAERSGVTVGEVRAASFSYFGVGLASAILERFWQRNVGPDPITKQVESAPVAMRRISSLLGVELERHIVANVDAFGYVAKRNQFGGKNE